MIHEVGRAGPTACRTFQSFCGDIVDECPPHRVRRARARACLGDLRQPAARRALLRARQCRHRARSPSASTSTSTDHAAVVRFSREHDIALVVIGPEAPLVAGLADDLAAARIKVFGPSKAAAQLEGSKGFTKDLCREHGIPTARLRPLLGRKVGEGVSRKPADPDRRQGRRPRRRQGRGDRRDVGAGAKPPSTPASPAPSGPPAPRSSSRSSSRARRRASLPSSTAGSVLPLASAQDHKRVCDGDNGPNTGGMGAYSPAPVMTPEMTARRDGRDHPPDRAGDGRARHALQRRAVRSA